MTLGGRLFYVCRASSGKDRPPTERWTQDRCCRSMVPAKAVRNLLVIPCVQWWCEMDNRAITPFSCCPIRYTLKAYVHYSLYVKDRATIYTKNVILTRANILTSLSLWESRIWRYSSHQRFAYVMNSLSRWALLVFSRLCWVDKTSSVSGVDSRGCNSIFSSRIPTTTLFSEPVTMPHTATTVNICSGDRVKVTQENIECSCVFMDESM